MHVVTSLISWHKHLSPPYVPSPMKAYPSFSSLSSMLSGRSGVNRSQGQTAEKGLQGEIDPFAR